MLKAKLNKKFFRILILLTIDKIRIIKIIMKIKIKEFTLTLLLLKDLGQQFTDLNQHQNKKIKRMQKLFLEELTVKEDFLIKTKIRKLALH
jgi:hypothetical protein